MDKNIIVVIFAGMKYEHIERLRIDTMEVELGFFKNDAGGYNCDIIKGDTGTGNISGGLDNLQQKIAEAKKQHIYSYYFFNKGYKSALQKISSL